MLKVRFCRDLTITCLAKSTCIHQLRPELHIRQIIFQSGSKSSRTPQSHRNKLQRNSSNLTAMDGNSSALSASAIDVPETSGSEQEVLVQYVVLRSDLWKSLNWPLGSIVAQACHAATAALWLSRSEEHSLAYCADGSIDHMHKVVLEVKGDVQLTNLAQKLQEAGVPHKLWVEQPENFPTCLATAPYPKSLLQQHFKKLKLCKGS